METRKQIAVTKKQSGCNCAQAVLCAYADIAGICVADAAEFLEEQIG